MKKGMTMYKSIIAIISLALFGVSQIAVGDNICHNYHEISVASSAVQAHLNHDDIVKETDVPCPQRPGSGPDLGDGMAAVVMMRCDLGSGLVVSFRSSPSFASTMPTDAVCVEALADLMDAGFYLRSVTSTGGDLTDYLLVGEVDEEEEEEEEEEDS
jgi:hypothetical protein